MPPDERTPRNYWLLAQASAAVLVGRIGLLILPLATVRRAVRFVLSSRRVLSPDQRCSAQVVVRAAVSAAIHSPVGSTCLSTALVTQALLLRHGHSASLRVGVRRTPEGTIAAHAWLEHEGQVVVGGPASEIAGYTPMPQMEHLIR